MNYSDKKAEVMLGTAESDLEARDGTLVIMVANRAWKQIPVFR